eukprot:11626003-Alexandrium_andersonii.AAC.1
MDVSAASAVSRVCETNNNLGFQTWLRHPSPALATSSSSSVAGGAQRSFAAPSPASRQGCPE